MGFHYIFLFLLADRRSGIKRDFKRVLINMTKICQVTGKKPLRGNNVSHAKNRTKRTFQPNVHKHRFWIESEKRHISLNVSAKGMRIIDKKGIDQVLSDIKKKGIKL